MERAARRILLAVEPAVLEGALAEVLSTGRGDEVVQSHQTRPPSFGAPYDAAVVSLELPDDLRADVVITLPDARSGSTGTVRSGEVIHQVDIAGAERVLELIEQYAPR